MNWTSKKQRVIVVILGVLFALIIARLDLRKSWAALAGIDWIWVSFVLFLNMVNTWIEAMRWRLILSSVKKQMRTSSTFAAILVGVVGNTLLPLRLGDGARAYFLARKEELDVVRSFSTLMLDRILDITFFLCMVAFTGMLFHLPAFIEQAGFVSGVGLGVGVMALLALIRLRRKLELKVRVKAGKKVAEQVSRFLEGLSGLKDLGILFPTSMLSILSWSVRWVMVLAMFRAFALELPLMGAFVVLVFSNLGIALVSTPANLGGFELSIIAALKVFGLDAEIGMSFAVVYHMVEVVPMVLLGMVTLWLSEFKSSEVLRHMPSSRF